MAPQPVSPNASRTANNSFTPELTRERGHPYRGRHALPAGDALARDVERGPVVDAGAHEREPQRHVDALVEARQLDRDVALVVVHGDHEVELAARRPPEERVG